MPSIFHSSELSPTQLSEALLTLMLREEDPQLTMNIAMVLDKLLTDDAVLEDYRKLPSEDAAFQHMLLTARSLNVDNVDTAVMYALLDRISPGWSTT